MARRHEKGDGQRTFFCVSEGDEKEEEEEEEEGMTKGVWMRREVE